MRLLRKFHLAKVERFLLSFFLPSLNCWRAYLGSGGSTQFVYLYTGPYSSFLVTFSYITNIDFKRVQVYREVYKD